MANAESLRKRIALVAAAALGVGMLAAAPAFAAGITPVIPAPADSYVAATALATSSTVMSFTGGAATDQATLSAVVATKPTGSVPSPVTFGTATAVTSGSTFTPATGVLLQGTGTNGSITATVPLLFTPDMAGTYTITVTNTATTLATRVWTVYAAGLAYQVGSTTAATPAITGGGLAGSANTVTVTGTTNALGNRALVTVSGAGATITSGGTIAVGGLSSVLPVGTTTSVVIATPTAGTVTVSEFYETGAGTGIYSGVADKTVTITVAGATNLAFSTVGSTSFLGATNVPATVDQVVAVPKSTGTQVANIQLSLKNASGTAYAGTDVTATVAGPALIVTNGTSTGIGNSRVAGSIGLTGGVGYVDISGDGTAGVATVTVSVGAVVFSTETVTFTGPLASLVATNVTAVNAIGANVGSVNVLAKDASGNPLPGVTVFASSATTANATVPVSIVTAAITGIASFTVTGVAAGTSVLTFGDLATSPTVSTTSTVTVGLSTGTTVTLAFDKASYAPGEKAVLTLTVKAAGGAAVADGTYTGLFTADLTSSVAVGGASLAGSKSPVLTNGMFAWTLYAPVTAGVFSVNGTTGTAGLVVAAQGLAVAGTATVTGGTAVTDAATAAANAATAAVATLATTVASFGYQLRVLNVLIKRIMARFHLR
jgi:hypothetical protein